MSFFKGGLVLKKNDIKLRGRLRAYLRLPVMLTPLLIAINIPVYMESVKSGIYFSGFVLLYFLIFYHICQRVSTAFPQKGLYIVPPKCYNLIVFF